MKILNKIKNGFSFIELAIFLAILAVIAAITLNVYGVEQSSKKTKITNIRLNKIEKALRAYANKHSKLPCPALLLASFSDDHFGTEDCSTATGNVHSVNVISGGVPVTALGLSPEYFVDGWGRRVVYVMDKDMANASNWQNGAVSPNIDIKKENDGHSFSVLYREAKREEIDTKVPDCRSAEIPQAMIMVSAAPPNNRIPVCAAFVLLSYGQNGYLAYDIKNLSVPISSGIIAGSSEKDNTAFSDTALVVDFDNVFLDNDRMIGSSNNPQEYFDDIILYRTKAQMQE